jgi:hypothetical protein
MMMFDRIVMKFYNILRFNQFVLALYNEYLNFIGKDGCCNGIVVSSHSSSP